MSESSTVQRRQEASVLPTRFAGLRGEPAQPTAAPRPRGDLTAADVDEIQQVVRGIWPGSPDAVRRRARGARFLLEHLAGLPGLTWQQRWETSGLNERGRPVTVVKREQAERDEICVGTACVFSLRVIRPSLQALRSTRFLRYGERFLTAQRDPLLEEFWKRVQDTAVHPVHHGAALFDTTAALTTQGVALADLTPEAFLHYVWETRDSGLAFKGRGESGRGQFPGQLAWQVLRDMGHFPSGTPTTLRGRRAQRAPDDPGAGRPLRHPPPGCPATPAGLFGAARTRDGLLHPGPAVSLAGWAVLGQDRGPRSQPAGSADRRRALPTVARGAGHPPGRPQTAPGVRIHPASSAFLLHRSAQLGGRRAREMGTVGGPGHPSAPCVVVGGR